VQLFLHCSVSCRLQGLRPLSGLETCPCPTIREGIKITYINNTNDPQHLYLPIELRDKYRIYRPQAASGDQNFLIVWKKGDTIERVEWFMPRVIDYDLPNYVIKPFGEEDKAVFDKIVKSGELTLDVEVITTEPQIRAPGGGDQ